MVRCDAFLCASCNERSLAGDYEVHKKERLSIAMNKLAETWYNNYFLLVQASAVAHAESKQAGRQASESLSLSLSLSSVNFNSAFLGHRTAGNFKSIMTPVNSGCK